VTNNEKAIKYIKINQYLGLPATQALLMTVLKSRNKKKTKIQPRKNQWMTLEQLSWLSDRLPEYHSIQLDLTLDHSCFWAQTFEDWFIKWPVPELTDEQKKNGIDKAKCKELVELVTESIFLLPLTK
jgi:hypothetical protein